MQVYYTIRHGTDRYECRTFTTRHFITKIVDAKDAGKIMEAQYGPDWKKQWTSMIIPTLTSVDIWRREYEKDMKEMKAKYGDGFVEQKTLPPIEPKVHLYRVQWSNYGYESGAVYVYSDEPVTASICAEEFHEYFREKKGHLESRRLGLTDLKPETWRAYCEAELERKQDVVESARRRIGEEQEEREKTEMRMRALLAQHDEKLQQRREELAQAVVELQRCAASMPELLNCT